MYRSKKKKKKTFKVREKKGQNELLVNSWIGALMHFALQPLKTLLMHEKLIHEWKSNAWIKVFWVICIGTMHGNNTFCVLRKEMHAFPTSLNLLNACITTQCTLNARLNRLHLLFASGGNVVEPIFLLYSYS